MGLDKNGDGKLNAADFLPLVSQLDTNHDGKVGLDDLPDEAREVLRQFDQDGDGMVTVTDLMLLLQESADSNGDGMLDMSDLPAPLRAKLLADLDENHDDTLSEEELEPIVHRLQRTDAGRAIIDQLDVNNDGHFSAQELSLSWVKLQALAAQVNANGAAGVALNSTRTIDANGDGKVDLNDLPQKVRSALLSTLDSNNDGDISVEDVVPFLNSLGDGAELDVLSKFDKNHDGKFDIDDLPPGMGDAVLSVLDKNHDGTLNVHDLPDGMGDALLAQLDHNHDGKISLDELPDNSGDALLAALDANGDGTISLDDIPHAIDQGLLSSFDTTGDGRITIADLNREVGAMLLSSMAHGGQPGSGMISLADLPSKFSRTIITSMDRNGDGVVDIHDLPGGMGSALLSTLNAQQGGSGLTTSDVQGRDAMQALMEKIAYGRIPNPPPPPPPPQLLPSGMPSPMGPEPVNSGPNVVLVVLIATVCFFALALSFCCWHRYKSGDRKPLLSFTRSYANMDPPMRVHLPSNATHAITPVMSPLYAADTGIVQGVQAAPAYEPSITVQQPAAAVPAYAGAAV